MEESNMTFQCANCGEYTTKLHKDVDHEYTCKWKPIDEILKKSGLRRGELTIFAASSGTGRSKLL